MPYVNFEVKLHLMKKMYQNEFINECARKNFVEIP